MSESRLRDLLRAMHLLGAVREDSAVAPHALCPLMPDLPFSEVSRLMELGERMGYLSRIDDRFYLTFRGEISVISISS
ncbi:MAG: hypothetical protein ACP5NG_02925 [Conexivisphaera sp.]